MFPINSKKSKCAVASSDCIIWDGRAIPCLDICKGDSMSDVTYKLATLVCTLQDALDISELDLECLELLKCDVPKSLMELIQILINRICALDNSESPTIPNSGCPTDCVIEVPECYWFVDPSGVQHTSMNLIEFVRVIANRTCGDKQSIYALGEGVNDLDERVTVLENKPEPVFVLPDVTPLYVLPSVPTPMDEVLEATEEQFGMLREASGSIDEIYNAVSKMPLGLSDSPRLSGQGTMATIDGWTRDNNKITDSINNIWLTLGDLRAAVLNISKNILKGCSGVDVVMQSVVSGSQLRVFLNGTIPSDYVDCSEEGALFKVSNNNGAFYEFRVPVLSILNNPTAYLVDLTDTAVSTSLDIMLECNMCLKGQSSGDECKSVLSNYHEVLVPCVPLTLTVGEDNVSYSATWTNDKSMVRVELWDDLETAMISSVAKIVDKGGLIDGIFDTLTPSTDYKIRTVIVKSNREQECAFEAFRTDDNGV